MGCNVSKDVKVDEQGNTDAQKNGDRMSEEKAAEKIQASFRGYKTRKSLKNNGLLPTQESVDTKLGEKAELEKAASTIQNSYRNFTKRKKEQEPTEVKDNKKEEEEVVDIDLGDPDVEKAALKIQATFRGYKKNREPKAQEQ